MSMRHVSIGLGIALVVIVGGILAVIASQRPASAPAGPLAGRSSASLPPFASPATHTPDGGPDFETPSPLQPTLEPEGPGTTSAPTEPATTPPDDPGNSPTATPEASPSATATPGPTPAAPTREITFSGVGLDSAMAPEEAFTPRYFSFSVLGPGDIQVRLSQSTGRVRACLWPGEVSDATGEGCRTMRRGSITRAVAGGAPERWTLSLIGADVAGSPSVTVRISYPTQDAAIHLEGFRFQGELIENYNGFVAEVRAAAGGTISVSAAFEDGAGGTHPYRLVIEEVGGGPSQPYLAESEGSSMHEQAEALAERGYRISLANREGISDALVMLIADIDWP
jgi:hypothetical protein